jgi:hypothetical protein
MSFLSYSLAVLFDVGSTGAKLLFGELQSSGKTRSVIPGILGKLCP